MLFVYMSLSVKKINNDDLATFDTSDDNKFCHNANHNSFFFLFNYMNIKYSNGVKIHN